MMAVGAFEAVLGGLRTYIFAHTSNRIDVSLGTQLFAHIVRLPLAYFQVRRAGDTVARARGLDTIRQFLTSSAITVVLDCFFTLVFFAVMLYYSPLLTAVVAGSLPCYVVLSIFVTPIIRARLRERFDRGAENQAFLVEMITGIETVKAMAVEPAMQRRWDDQLAEYVRASFRATLLSNTARQIASWLNKITTVALVWIGATLVMRGRLTIGQLIAFNMLAGRVSDPVLRLVQLWQDFQQAGIAVERLGDVLNAPLEPHASGAGTVSRTTLPNITGPGHLRAGALSLPGRCAARPAGSVVRRAARHGDWDRRPFRLWEKHHCQAHPAPVYPRERARHDRRHRRGPGRSCLVTSADRGGAAGEFFI